MQAEQEAIIDDLLDELKPLRFDAPVSHVYNPLAYARASYVKYLQLYAESPKEIVLIGQRDRFGTQNAASESCCHSSPLAKNCTQALKLP